MDIFWNYTLWNTISCNIAICNTYHATDCIKLCNMIMEHQIMETCIMGFMGQHIMQIIGLAV